MTRLPPIVTVIGEALIDPVRLGVPGDCPARVGDSPYGAAIGLARLGHHSALMARMACNTFGRMLHPG